MRVGQVRPRVVALGGGHGLAATLTAARLYAGDLTAIVSVADDGGSSGRLRRDLGIPPPGDIRRCLLALADPNSALARSFEHRFEVGDLAGHPLGNLLIAGLAATSGDFSVAVAEVAALLDAYGRVLPATRTPVELAGESDGGEIAGQSALNSTRGVRRVRFCPDDPEIPEEVAAAISSADQIVIGPGSLYTSVLAVAAIPRIRKLLIDARGQRLYVCNLAPQEPETSAYDVGRHISALAVHGVPVDAVLIDPATLAEGHIEVPVSRARLARSDGRTHDPTLLAGALSRLAAGWQARSGLDWRPPAQM